MSKWDVVLVVQKEYVNLTSDDEYHRNIQQEDELLMNGLLDSGLKATIVAWDDKDFDWTSIGMAVIRETWDYFHRIEEFRAWLDSVQHKTTLINPYETLIWNLDKFYLGDLEEKGINIPETLFIEKGDTVTLKEIHQNTNWEELIIKPAVAGAARDTYRIPSEDIQDHEVIFRDLVQKERMLVQNFQSDILVNGERTLVMINGEFTHAILKKAKQGDFRVQDDHGGTVHDYTPTDDEIAFARKAMLSINPVPVYGRVDIITDVNGALALQELELIEPELWFRFEPKAALKLAQILKSMN